MAEDVTSMIEIAAPRERVWEALSRPDLVIRWLGCLGFRPEAGHVFHLQQGGEVLLHVAIAGLAHVDAPRRLSFSWGFPDVPDTWVDIRLRRIPGGTYVRLVHSGWNQFEDHESEEMRGGMGSAWHSVALPALRAVAEDV